ncbi:MAG: NPCBM/NEW2 domain-containing protein [Eubacteriales bacterium]|nr:NPCBM/NEW2 domain-containing protein [Eubacteriales bacterium]
MPSEMDFLRAKWPKLAALGSEAERLMQITPAGAIECLQSFCSWAADISLELLDIRIAAGAADEEKLGALYASGLMPPEIVEKFQIVFSAGSNSLYRVNITTNEAYTCFNHALDIGRWMKRESEVMRTGRSDAYRPGPPPEIPVESSRRPNLFTPPPPATGVDADTRPFYARDDHADGAPRRAAYSKYAPPAPPAKSGVMALFDEYRQYFYIGLAALAMVVVGVVIALAIRNAGKTGPLVLPSVTPPTVSADILPSQEPTPSPTPQPQEQLTALSSLTPTGTAPKYLTKDRWNFNSPNADFNMNGTKYTSGLGMFVASSTIREDRGSQSVSYKLESKYTQLRFDLGCDDQLKGYSDNYGQFRLQIFCDDESDPRYNSDFQKFDFFQANVAVDVANVTTIKIVLTEEKGDDGTLNVIMGNAALVNAEPAEGGATASPTPDASATPTPSPTPSATPST